ncbi:MAG: thioredoxin [Planctomycetota bacterium]|nr:thioredoxin [Planctomycetota bacterium]MCZ6690063.1 thioredoxin [Planctomycetota bacterium]
MASVQKVTDKDFQAEVLDSTLPVLVDFSAEWCGPCKKLAPIVEELAGEYDGKLKVVTLDIDESRETPTKYGIMSVPTMFFIKGGEVVDRLVGLNPKDRIKEKITSLV